MRRWIRVPGGRGNPPAPTLVTPPVIAAASAWAIGAGWTITPAVVTGVVTSRTYTLERDGTPITGVIGVSEAALEAHARVAADIGRHITVVETITGPGGVLVVESAAIKAALEDAITILYTAASWVAVQIFLARADALTDAGGGKVSVWANLGTLSDGTQGVDASRPVYSATGLDGAPGLGFAGTQLLQTDVFDLSAYTAAAWTVFADPTAGALGYMVGTDPGAGTIGLLSDNSTNNRFVTEAAGNVGGARAATSNGSFVSTAVSRTATIDFALSTNEAEIRINGANATAARPQNNNNSSTLSATRAPVLGARGDGTTGFTGSIGAVVLAVGTTAVPVSTVALVEGLLAKAHAEGSYA